MSIFDIAWFGTAQPGEVGAERWVLWGEVEKVVVVIVRRVEGCFGCYGAMELTPPPVDFY